MRSKIHFVLLAAALSFVFVLDAGCSRRARLARTLDQANRYFAAGQYDQAEIEYLNALKLRPGDPAAIGQLGIIYFNEGQLGRGVAYLNKAHELEPDNLDVRLKLGEFDLATGDRTKAQTEAEFILDHRPADPEAPMLLANASVQPDEVAKARARLQKLPTPRTAPVEVALGMLDFRGRHLDKAEAAFKRALKLDPKFSQAHAALSALYNLQGKAKEAGQELQQAAAFAPERSPYPLQYAQYLVQTGGRKQAQTVLEGVTKKTPDFLPAWIQLARLVAGERNFTESESLLAKVRARDRNNPGAMLLAGQIKLAEGKPADAIAAFQKMRTIYPKAAAVYYQLGTAYVAAGDVDKAISNLNQAVSIAPRYADAQILLAGLHLRRGDLTRAIVGLKAVTRENPGLIQAWLLLANAYRAQSDYGDARSIYEQLEKSFPKSPQIPFLIGSVLIQQRQFDAARKALTRALEIAPDYLPALEQMVNIDLINKQYAEARKRVDARMKTAPKNAGLQMLIAKIDLAQNRTAPGEDALKQAIKLQPNAPTPYLLLAQLYVRSKREKEALASLKDLAAKNPKDATPYMMMGVIYELEKNYDAARNAYEKVLAINPDFGAALNNLAYLDSEKFHDLDKAFALAQRSRELLPNEPHVADTLGWIVFQRGQYPWALTLLQEAASRLPDQAQAVYHLGMAQYMMGQSAAARASLQRSLKINAAFTGADEAKDRLAILDIDPQKAGPVQESLLKKAVAAHPDDPVALTDLAAIYQRQGEGAKAVDALKSALKANPKNVTAMMGLVRTYMAQHDTDQALALAKNARQLAPDDVEVTHTLARLAYETGDCTWAASLLQQAVLKQPDDPGLLYDLALADYGTGDVSDAVTSAQQALQANASFDRAAEARRFLQLTALTGDPAKALAASAEVADTLKSDPTSVPALMAQGTIEEAHHAAAAAARIYEKVLGLRPGFSPAQRRLVILYAADPANDKNAAKLGPQAIQAYPQDPALARAWGIILYRQGNFGRAANELQMAAGQYADDPELRYYLGMAQVKNGAPTTGVKTLNEALKLGLKGELASEAKVAIAAQKKGSKGVRE